MDLEDCLFRLTDDYKDQLTEGENASETNYIHTQIQKRSESYRNNFLYDASFKVDNLKMLLNLRHKSLGPRASFNDRQNCCSWCFTSWSDKKYTTKIIPQKKKRRFPIIESHLFSKEKKYKFNTIVLKCLVCNQITKLDIKKDPKINKFMRRHVTRNQKEIENSKLKNKKTLKQNVITNKMNESTQKLSTNQSKGVLILDILNGL